MQFIVLGAIGLGLLIGLGQIFVRSDPRTLVRLIRYAIGTILILFGGVMTFGGRWGIGLPLIVVGATALARGRIGPFDLGGGRPRTTGRESMVRTAFLEMRLEHGSGVVSGRAIAGEFAGRNLDDLAEASLFRLLREVAGDADSVSLVEVYLDRRVPGWREDVQNDANGRTSGPAGASTMSDEEAYEVLGLAPGAGTAEIRAAHRRLMKLVHPDQGGSTFLATKLNQAKDKLLGRHRY